MRAWVRGLALAAIVVATATAPASASPRDDLASVDPAARDAAAATLRQRYRPTARGIMARAVRPARPGLTVAAALHRLRRLHPTSEGGASGGGGTTESYRVDDAWVLVIYSADERVTRTELVADTRRVWVEPPPGFTGTWVTYFASGHVAYRVDYVGGTYLGEFRSYHDNGAPAVVQRYGKAGIDGDEVGYHRTGQVAYRGQHRAGKRVGAWTHYDVAGKVTRTEQLPP